MPEPLDGSQLLFIVRGTPHYDSRWSHESNEFTSLDNTIDILQKVLRLLGLTVLYRDCHSLPRKAAYIGVGELGVIARHHLLDIRHSSVRAAAFERELIQIVQTTAATCAGVVVSVPKADDKV